MSNDAITYSVAATAGVFGLAIFVAFVLVPAWSSYSRAWERVAATFMSLYVLVFFVALGVGLGAAFIWFYDRI
jgi:hypothetical protein